MKVVVWCLRLQIFREIFVCLFVCCCEDANMGGENRHLPAPSSLTRMARSTDTSKRPPNTVVVDHEGKCAISDEMTCAITS